MKGLSPVLSQSAMVLVAAVLTVGLASGISTGLRLAGETGPGRLGEVDAPIIVSSANRQSSSAKSSSKGTQVELEEENEGSKACILFVNPCPLTDPRCGMDILKVEIACTDVRCTPESCVTKEELSKVSSSRRSSSVPAAGPNACVQQNFACIEGAQSSCFKRLRSTQLECTDTRCAGGACIPASVFFASQKLQPWDMGPLEGPFPRKETMCVIQRSACDPGDASCVSPVSLEQIDCRNCSGSTCTRIDVLVDERDNILGNAGSGNTDEGESGTTTQEPTLRPAAQTAPLGCFNNQGAWTTDRNACASDQNRFLQQTGTIPTVTVLQVDSEIQREIDRQIVPDTTRSSTVQTLLSSIYDASDRLTSMLRLSLPDDLRAAVTDSIEWLKLVQRDAQDSSKTMKELQDLAASIGMRLEDIQVDVSAWSATQPTPQRNPETLTGKMDLIFGNLAAAFGIIQAELIVLPPSVFGDYSEALSLYEGLKPACLSNPDLCGRLTSVVDLLESAVMGLQQALEEAGRQDLIDQIDAMF
jgi:hypothetical protein